MPGAGKENVVYNEAETSLVDRCGFCNLEKRAEKVALHPDMCRCPSASESTDPNIRVGSVPSSSFRRTSNVQSQSGGTLFADTNIGLVEVVTIREKHGYFRKAIPHLPMPVAVILCLFNVLIPGSGTLISILGILCGCKTEHGSKRRSSLISLMAACIQLITALFIVGWIWSILWGITFVNITASKDMEGENPTSML